MTDQPDHARSFGSVADAYDRGRPGYPAEAVAWLVGEQPLTVLEIGAGTGKLTDALVAAGHDVHATDPDDEMLARLRLRLPDVRTSTAAAEELPVPDASYDVVIGAQCFHWFDHERALPEIARVLKPGGHLALVWNQRDERIPWVKKLGRIIGSQERGTDPTDEVDASGCFGPVEHELHKHWQVIDRDSIQDLVLSRSNVAVLDEEGRRAKLAEVLAFYDDYGRGMDGMQLPYVVSCFRAPVADRIVRTPVAEDGPPAAEPTPAVDDDVLLIDFR
ncbi:class I SAM-dependent methyltransferase [Nocardioides mangrovi]|uniref:Class I SAM-dependent methyltransferase n=1 Tax=Nocardioides mangrovi TaxID=2874580 RepID=A0ABS7UE92_9ACTN|nr:class I SAM-dependent methyltransferase [Nocardioides mangrovi]MBZ5739097.1 class I SAM-dependent methyltransferase [Nocardioides mangrovi]